MNSELNTNPTEQQTQVSAAESQPKKNKILLTGIAVGIIVLLLLLVGLLTALLIQEKSSNKSIQEKTANGTSENTIQSESDDKKIIKTIQTQNDKFEIYIYEPKQKGSNTTFEYGIHNKCDDCEKSEFESLFSLSGSSSESYLLDENAGNKYSPIEDADGKRVATAKCSAFIEPGDTLDCFAAFTKVPSDTTVSLILGSLKIDNITIK